MITLRPYQQDTVNNTLQALEDGQAPVIIAATGSGKTVMFSTVAAEWIRRHGGRVLVLAHRTELLTQGLDTMRTVEPSLTPGIVQGARRDIDANIIYASVASLSTPTKRDEIKNVTLIIVDECHRSRSRTHETVIGHYREKGAALLGVTATPKRGDGKALGTQYGGMYDTITGNVTIATLVREGFLLPPVGRVVEIPQLHLEDVTVRGGDYVPSDLGGAMSQALAPKLIVEAWLEHAADRHTIVFTPTIRLAEEIVDEYRTAGIRADIVSGHTPKRERAELLKDYKEGTVQVVVNALTLVEGFDAPITNCVVLARPTKSEVIFKQAIGRGLRLHPGQTDCIVLDVTGATGHHTLADSKTDLNGSGKKDPRGDSPRVIDILEGADPEGEPEAPDYYLGRTVSRVVDLFGGRQWRWVTTDGGTPVAAAADYFVGVVETAPGVWGVFRAGRAAETGGGGWVDATCGDKKAARDKAEVEVARLHAESGTRRSPRLDAGPATARDIKTANAWGVDVPAGATRGEARDMVNAKIASIRIDPVVSMLHRRNNMK